MSYTVQGKAVQTKEQALKALCATANSNCLHIEHLWCYKDICEQWAITPADYYNDEASLDQKYLDNAGNNNWKPILPRILVVDRIDHDESNGFMVVEQLWDDMAGNYWGAASDAPSKFDTEDEAEAWISVRIFPEPYGGQFYQDHGSCEYCYFVGDDPEQCTCPDKEKKVATHE